MSLFAVAVVTVVTVSSIFANWMCLFGWLWVSGTNVGPALEILKQSGMPLIPADNMDQAAKKAVQSLTNWPSYRWFIKKTGHLRNAVSSTSKPGVGQRMTFRTTKLWGYSSSQDWTKLVPPAEKHLDFEGILTASRKCPVVLELQVLVSNGNKLQLSLPTGPPLAFFRKTAKRRTCAQASYCFLRFILWESAFIRLFLGLGTRRHTNASQGAPWIWILPSMKSYASYDSQFLTVLTRFLPRSRDHWFTVALGILPSCSRSRHVFIFPSSPIHFALILWFWTGNIQTLGFFSCSSNLPFSLNQNLTCRNQGEVKILYRARVVSTERYWIWKQILDGTDVDESPSVSAGWGEEDSDSLFIFFL